ncbi:hypothetical protein RI367_003231 [Sorochytrium milnesiophthora]
MSAPSTTADYMLSTLLTSAEMYSPAQSPALSLSLADLSSAWGQSDALFFSSQQSLPQPQDQLYSVGANLTTLPHSLPSVVSPYYLWAQPYTSLPVQSAGPTSSSVSSELATTSDDGHSCHSSHSSHEDDDDDDDDDIALPAERRLPAYEMLITEALTALNKPGGIAPRIIFDWMQENYPDLPRGFRGSATQALKKALHKRRVLRTKRSGYIVNPAYESKPVYGRVKKGSPSSDAGRHANLSAGQKCRCRRHRADGGSAAVAQSSSSPLLTTYPSPATWQWHNSSPPTPFNLVDSTVAAASAPALALADSYSALPPLVSMCSAAPFTPPYPSSSGSSLPLSPMVVAATAPGEQGLYEQFSLHLDTLSLSSSSSSQVCPQTYLFAAPAAAHLTSTPLSPPPQIDMDLHNTVAVAFEDDCFRQGDSL